MVVEAAPAAALVGPEPAWCRDRLVGAEELGGVGERPFRPVLPVDPDHALQAQPGPPPPYSATAAQGHELIPLAKSSGRGQAAIRRTRRERRVVARGLPCSQAFRRTTLRAAALATCCR